jgi:hypothetical protein
MNPPQNKTNINSCFLVDMWAGLATCPSTAAIYIEAEANGANDGARISSGMCFLEVLSGAWRDSRKINLLE